MPLQASKHSWWCCFQVHSQHRLAQIIAAADKVAKILVCYFSLDSDLVRLLLFELKLLDPPLQTNADVIGRAFECTVELGADS